jgi:hypothetical protein
MKESLAQLLNAAVQVHTTAMTTLDARRQFKLLIEEAYSIGQSDARSELQKSQTQPPPPAPPEDHPDIAPSPPRGPGRPRGRPARV